jgi:hypothetical protein
MEIFVGREILADQLRADHLAVLCHQAASRLMRKKKLGKPGHAQGIDQAGDQSHQHDHQNGRTDLLQHENLAFKPDRWR